MNEEKALKPGWRHVKFGDVVRLSKARSQDPLVEGIERYVGLEHLEPSDLRIRSWGSVADGVTFTSVFQPGQVLFGKRRAYQRKVAVADFSGVCSGDIYVLETKDAQVLLPELLPFICQTDAFFDHAVGTSAGSLSPRTNWTSLADFEFVLPKVEEQLRIVELLQTFDDVHESLLATSKASSALKSSLTESAFPVSEARSFLNDPKSYQGRLLVNLGDLATLQVGFPFKSAKYSKNGDRLLRGSNVGVNRLLWGDDITCYWPSALRNEVLDYVLTVGDLVIAMDRPFISEGFKIARVSEHDLPALLLQRVGRFKLSQKITADYLWAFLHSESFKWQLQRMQKGTDLPHISRFDIEGTLIPALSLDEQIATADFFSSVAEAEKSLRIRLDANRQQRSEALVAQILSEAPNV